VPGFAQACPDAERQVKGHSGPAARPLTGTDRLNIGQVIATINEKTKSFAGMQVPVKVIVDKDAKTFEIEVGTPPVSALVKKAVS
jgi:large subunit ribosomal protein L11